MRFVGVGQEPANVGNLVGASARLSSGHFIAASIVAALAGAIENGGQHAFAKLRKERTDVKFALYTWNKSRRICAGFRILQIIESSAIGECSGKRRELKRSDLNAFAEAGHARHAAFCRRRHRKRTRMFVGEIVAGEFTETEQTTVLGNGA